jgi:hypothetical protein
VSDDRPLPGKASKGESTSAPCPLLAVRTAAEKPTVASLARGVLDVDL